MQVATVVFVVQEKVGAGQWLIFVAVVAVLEVMVVVAIFKARVVVKAMVTIWVFCVPGAPMVQRLNGGIQLMRCSAGTVFTYLSYTLNKAVFRTNITRLLDGGKIS